MSNNKSGNWFARHKVLTGFLAIVTIIIIGVSIGNGSGTKTSNSSPTASTSGSKSASSTGTLAKINQPANDGKLQFTITSFQCGVSQIEQPDDTDYVVTQGAPYCVMNLSVKNISNQSQTFDSSSQYVYDAGSKQYSVDSTATIGANPTSSQFMELPTVNPGVSLSGILVFDIPAGVTPTSATLHDSSLSNGVKVSLQ
jgi:hypothetical protein